MKYNRNERGVYYIRQYDFIQNIIERNKEKKNQRKKTMRGVSGGGDKFVRGLKSISLKKDWAYFYVIRPINLF